MGGGARKRKRDKLSQGREEGQKALTNKDNTGEKQETKAKAQLEAKETAELKAKETEELKAEERAELKTAGLKADDEEFYQAWAAEAVCSAAPDLTDSERLCLFAMAIPKPKAMPKQQVMAKFMRKQQAMPKPKAMPKQQVMAKFMRKQQAMLA